MLQLQPGDVERRRGRRLGPEGVRRRGRKTGSLPTAPYRNCSDFLAANDPAGHHHDGPHLRRPAKTTRVNSTMVYGARSRLKARFEEVTTMLYSMGEHGSTRRSREIRRMISGI